MDSEKGHIGNTRDGSGRGSDADSNEKHVMSDHANQHVHEALRTIENPSTTQVSIRDILKGSATSPLTAFEKKAALINAEIDNFGFGRYQICIWFLCGFGYFLDLAWSQGVGLIATAIYQEMNVPDDNTAQLYSMANAGLAFGAFSWGLAVDVIGRKWAFNLTCLITSVFGLLLAAPKFNYNAICGIYFLASIGLGGNIPIDATIALEYLPQNRRNLVTLLSLWQPIGVVVASAIAFGTAARPKWRCDANLPSCAAIPDGQPQNSSTCCTVASNMGWRYLVIVLGCMTLAVFLLRFFVFTFYETPKFLLSKGHEEKAIEVLHKIAKFNKAPPPTLTVEMFRAIDETTTLDSREPAPTEGPLNTKQTTRKVLRNFVRSFDNLKALFTNRLQTFIFALLAVAYMGDYWSFNLAGQFLPIILLRNEVTTDGSVTETYRHYIYIYLPGILGAVMGLFSVQLPLIGRKWSLVISAILQGLAMAMYTQVATTAGYVGLNAFQYIMQTYFNAVLYASAPELFATAYRGSASGMLSCLGRIAGIVAPFAGQAYLAAESSGILWLGAGGIWVSALVLVFLPVEMRNRQMF
ncbi:Putative major facilitator, sugar transporter, major facilitator superfamily [Septoria linicola]|uniref:Major facilitator, sugar transporter, major facilitator superfamily n=1 Tax=Septoria linicola TaxID=215465 RepID=A0A9Q9EQ71_9PEZI|nr:putative major facilitator, sugar transporter, major facilitator superfamily [Septoria linicola]USW58487.1 Putative major facilitator, sugar transporter, major facilitator superfamily [Septoria linicola]